MNQILISETLYVTPEIKRKKFIYKLNFFLAIIFMIILSFYYAYGEYNRYLDEKKSTQILRALTFNIEETNDGSIKLSDDKIRVVLNREKKVNGSNQKQERTPEELRQIEEKIKAGTKKSKSGDTYYPIGVINIPKFDIEYPILNKTTPELLELSPTKFWGPEPNTVGNFSVVGHNYRTKQFFSQVPKLENGDLIEIKDLLGKIVQYKVYDKFQVKPEDTSATGQYTNGKREITLITCTNDGNNRIIVKAREI